MTKPAIPELPTVVTWAAETFHMDALHHWENVAFSAVAATAISVVFMYGARGGTLVPKGLQNALELFLETLQSMVIDIIGPNGNKYVPFIGTIFVYVLSINLFGLIPMMKSASADLSVTAGIAIVVFLLVQFLNLWHKGIGGFLFHLAGSPRGTVAWCMVPLMFPIEVITELSRPLTLAFRLFGNIFGEHVLVSYFALMGLTGLLIQTPLFFLALFTALLQAFVFALLATVYILLAMSHGETEEHY